MLARRRSSCKAAACDTCRRCASVRAGSARSVQRPPPPPCCALAAWLSASGRSVGTRRACRPAGRRAPSPGPAPAGCRSSAGCRNPARLELQGGQGPTAARASQSLKIIRADPSCMCRTSLRIRVSGQRECISLPSDFHTISSNRQQLFGANCSKCQIWLWPCPLHSMRRRWQGRRSNCWQSLRPFQARP